MRLFIEPMDVWLFRDGRPFTAGSAHRAWSRFPPYPTVMQGVLRSHHLVVRRINLADPKAIAQEVGTATDYKGLRMRGPFVARRENDTIVRYFPVPADAAWRSGKEIQALRPVKKTGEGILTSVPTSCLLLDNDKPEKYEGNRWVSQTDLMHYLNKDRRVPTVSGEELFQREARPGIGLDDRTHTTRKIGDGGLLYEVAFVRPGSGVGLEIEVQGLSGWPAAGLMRMGGEGRAGYFSASNAAPWPLPPTPLPQRFKIYFATPAWFEEGWQPRDGNWGKFFTGRVELVAAAIGRYESIGGFDWAKQDHKPARRYVPAGSVYFFESDGTVALAPNLINQAITDDGAEIGFGQIIIGRW